MHVFLGLFFGGIVECCGTFSTNGKKRKKTDLRTRR
jgi:hypothetical protein